MADETVRPARLYISLVSNLANYGLKLLPLASIHTGAAATREGPAHHAETFRPLAGPYQEPLTFAVLLLKASASLTWSIVKLDWLLSFGSLTDASNVRASVPLDCRYLRLLRACYLRQRTGEDGSVETHL